MILSDERKADIQEEIDDFLGGLVEGQSS